MNKKLDKILGPVLAFAGFGGLLLLSIAGLVVQIINGGNSAGVIMVLIPAFALATGISLYTLIKTVLLITTGAQETMRFLGNPHKGESQYAGPGVVQPYDDLKPKPPSWDPPVALIDEEL